MKEFRTRLTSLQTKFRISHSDQIFLIGSCFAQEIGALLTSHSYQVCESPFGIVFNPLSINNQLNRILSHELYREEELILMDELYHSMDHHGYYSHQNKNEMLDRINTELTKSREFLLRANYLIISLGSSYYYRLISNSKVVSNCHKLPSKEFDKSIIDLNLTTNLLQATISNLIKNNPKLKILITISPVRYLRDGLIENNRSKARLFLMVEELCNTHSRIEYFPSYELLVDELRDYRFYADDMLHPSTQAILYIWEYFANAYFDENTKILNEKISQLNQLISHRPIHFTDLGMNQIKSKAKYLRQEILKINPDINLMD